MTARDVREFAGRSAREWERVQRWESERDSDAPKTPKAAMAAKNTSAPAPIPSSFARVIELDLPVADVAEKRESLEEANTRLKQELLESNRLVQAYEEKLGARLQDLFSGNLRAVTITRGPAVSDMHVLRVVFKGTREAIDALKSALGPESREK